MTFFFCYFGAKYGCIFCKAARRSKTLSKILVWKDLCCSLSYALSFRPAMVSGNPMLCLFYLLCVCLSG